MKLRQHLPGLLDNQHTPLFSVIARKDYQFIVKFNLAAFAPALHVASSKDRRFGLVGSIRVFLSYGIEVRRRGAVILQQQ